MTPWAPVVVVGVALAGALLVAVTEQVVRGGRADPVGILRRAGAMLDEPLAAPAQPDRWLFHLAPGLLLAAGVVALATVPWAPGFTGIDVPSGAILFAGALAYVTPAVFMAGWGSGSPLAVLGGFRFVGLMLAYAMPLAMVITAVAAPAGSLRPSAIVDVQRDVPMIVAQPLAFLLFVPAAMAVALLPPFDLAHAPAEMRGGVFDRYTGVHAAVVALARRILVLAVAAMTAALFLGGWHGPLLPGAAWMAVKTLLVVVGMVWLGERLPRPPLDWLLPWAWKAAIPAAIAAIVYAGLLTLLAYR